MTQSASAIGSWGPTHGRVGISGVPGDQKADENCAKSALAKVADQLK